MNQAFVSTQVTCRNQAGDVKLINDAIASLGNPSSATAVQLVGTCAVGATEIIKITASNTFLRGTSPSSRATLRALGTTSRPYTVPIIQIGSANDRKVPMTDTRSVLDPYVPAGSDTFAISGAALNTGDEVVVVKPLTKEWAAAMKWSTGYWSTYSCPKSSRCTDNMDYTQNIYWERTVAKMTGNRVTLDAPISDNLNKTYGNAVLAKTVPLQGRINNVGLLYIDGNAGSTTTSADNHERDNVFLSVNNAQNVWVSDVKANGFNTGIFLGFGTR